MSEAEVTIGKVLAPQAGTLVFDPPKSTSKTLDIVLLTSNPSTGEMKASGSLGLAVQPAQPK